MSANYNDFGANSLRSCAPVPNEQSESEELVTEIRELAAHAEAMGADQQRILNILRDAISRAQAILERFRSGEGTKVNCRRCNAMMTEKECGQSLCALTLHARAQTGIAATQQQVEWAQSQLPLCAACVSDMIQEHLGIPHALSKWKKRRQVAARSVEAKRTRGRSGRNPDSAAQKS
jgi:hypothetical protein